MLMVIGYIFVLGVYMVCPKALKLAIFIANIFIPDPLPYLDEIIMAIGLAMDS